MTNVSAPGQGTTQGPGLDPIPTGYMLANTSGATAVPYAVLIGAAGGGIIINTTAITGGTIGNVLYHKTADVVGELTTSGSGTVLVLATGASLVTPVLGAATATSINKVALTAPASSATLTIADGKTLTASNSITLAGTDSTTMTFPTTTATVARTDAAQTFTGIQTFNTAIASGSVAAMTATVGGGVPTPPNDATKYLNGQGAFTVPAGGGGGLTIGTTTITSGTDGRLLWDSGGTTLQETVGASYSSTTQTLTLTPTGNNSALVLTGTSVTTSNPVLSMTQTWNAGAVTFTGILLTVTNTASAAASNLIDLKVGATSEFSVTRAGNLTANGTASFAGSAATISGSGAIHADGTIDSLGDLRAGQSANINWTNRMRMTSPANGTIKLANDAVTAGGVIDVATDGTFKFFGRDGTTAAPIQGASYLSSAPTTGTAGTWKLGIRVAATVVLDTTQYIQLDVGGTLYKLGLVS